jgi:DNA repair exonuclease SbcCD nuclease subunit
MKIAVISDLHFGYGYSSELEEDSFVNAEEAIQSAISSGADIILMPGDIFDSRFPKTDVLSRATKILVRPLLEENSGVKLTSCSKELKKISNRTLQHLPIVAIHGTHERRYGSNIVEALENAGILIHLHREAICLEKDGVRIAIHGMSGVPERYAKRTLQEWNPKPIEGNVNILVLHQSIDPFIYSPLEPAMLKLDDMPRGFDLIIDGHLHMHGIEKTNDAPLLFPGSTVITQFEENEAEGEKGFYMIDVGPEKKLDMKFVSLKNRRKFFLREIPAGTQLGERIGKEIDSILSMNDNLAKRPLVKIKITGSSSEVIEQELKETERKYSERTILRMVKKLENPEFSKKVEFLRKVREEKLSVEEMGLKMLKENLDGLRFEGNFDHEKVFGMLVDGKVDNAFNILTGDQRTLGERYDN